MPKKVPQPHGGSITIQEKGDKSSNPNGRPKSLIGSVLSELQQKGHVVPAKSDIEKTFILFTALDVKSLEEIYKNEKNPVFMRTVAKTLMQGLTSQRGIDEIEKILDRAIGKASGGNDTPPIQIDKANILVQLPSITKSQE